jgi:biopolymer transport protein ExbB/TolQ
MDGLVISPVGMFLQAGPIGKAVMAVLLAASVWCWILIIEGLFTVVKLSRVLKAARLDKGASLPPRRSRRPDKRPRASRSPMKARAKSACASPKR